MELLVIFAHYPHSWLIALHFYYSWLSVLSPILIYERVSSLERVLKELKQRQVLQTQTGYDSSCCLIQGFQLFARLRKYIISFDFFPWNPQFVLHFNLLPIWSSVLHNLTCTIEPDRWESKLLEQLVLYAKKAFVHLGYFLHEHFVPICVERNAIWVELDLLLFSEELPQELTH